MGGGGSGAERRGEGRGEEGGGKGAGDTWTYATTHHALGWTQRPIAAKDGKGEGGRAQGVRREMRDEAELAEVEHQFGGSRVCFHSVRVSLPEPAPSFGCAKTSKRNVRSARTPNRPLRAAPALRMPQSDRIG